MNMAINGKLKNQSLGRELTEMESRLAQALEAVYITQPKDFDAVVAYLNINAIEVPSTGSIHWTLEILENELQAINDSLDRAYRQNGCGASYPRETIK